MICLMSFEWTSVNSASSVFAPDATFEVTKAQQIALLLDAQSEVYGLQLFFVFYELSTVCKAN